MSDSSQQSDQKPVLSKYARAKLRKEQKKAEEERIRKLQEDERLRRQQGGGAAVGSAHPQTPTQVAQPLSMPVATPQPHPKLLEGKQQVVQAIPAVKLESQTNQHAGTASQRGPVVPIRTGHVGIRAPGQVDFPATTVSQATSQTATKAANVGSVGGEKNQMITPQAASPMSRYPGVAGVGNPAHPVAGGATVGGSSMPQGGGGVRQGPPYVLASELRSPAMNFSTGTAAPGVKDATGSGSGGPGGSGSQAASGGVKTPVKKPAVGQKKPGEAIPAASQPANKKQKSQGPEADQSIDALNDVTAVSGVNLREEEEQLLAGPKEGSRTTEAMRKFVQEEEERLFLEKGPLRAKVQAIAAKCGLSLSEDMERCLSLLCDTEKDLHNTVVGFDLRRQVLMLPKRKAKEAMEKKVAAEKERLRKLNETFKAKRVAMLKFVDSGFEEKVKTRKDQKVKFGGQGSFGS